MVAVELPGGEPIEVVVAGAGPAVMALVDPRPATGEEADELRRWGVDPRRGQALSEGLRDRFTVIAVPYEAHVLDHPRPDTLTPDTVAADLLAIADAVGANRFACYGYSWLAVAALQLALRTDRLTALAMGGYPPLDGPYSQLLAVTAATHEMATGIRPRTAAEPASEWDSGEMTLSPAQTGQFVTFYEALADFDDRAALAHVACPRLCFAGTEDRIEYAERWGGLDHLQAMQPHHVLPVLKPWLTGRLVDL